MSSNAFRIIYDVCFFAGVAVLAYLYRGLYADTEKAIEPYVQAYTPVVMALLCIMLLLIFNYIREAIAGTFISVTNRATGSGQISYESGKYSKNILKTARQMQRRRDYQAAGEAYESLELWRDAALVYEKGNIYAKAAAAWEQAEDPQRAIELYERDGSFESAARVCLNEGMSERAARNYRHAGDACHEQNQLARAAEFYEKAEDYPRAAAIFEKSHKLDRALAAYERTGNSDKVLEIIKAIPAADYIRRGPQFTQLIERGAELINNNGNPEAAAEILEDAHIYTRAAEIYASNKMWQRSAELYLKADQPEMAETVIGKIPQAEDAAELMATLAIKRGDWKAAGEYFEKAGKRTQAVDAFKKAREFADAARIYDELGRYILAGEMYSSAKDFHSAANAYAKAYDWRNAAECFEQCGDKAQAIEAYANAANYLKAGKLALSLTDYARAVEYLQRIPHGSPDETAGTAFLATAFYYQSHEDMAFELFYRSMEKLPVNRENLPVWYAWARYLEKYDPQKSLGLFRQILGVDVHYSDTSDRVQHLEQVVSHMTRDGGKNTTPGIVQQRRPDFTPDISAGSPVAQHGPKVLGGAPITAATQITTNKTALPPLQTAAAASAGNTGEVIAHRYQLHSAARQIGRIVDYAAIDLETNMPITVRTFPHPNDAAIYDATITMLKKAEALHHSSLAPILSYGEERDQIYVVSAAPAGQSVHQLVRMRGPMSVDDARRFFMQLLEALDYAHSQDVCHLNLRPDVITQSSEDGSPYILGGLGVPVRLPISTEPVYATTPDIDPQYMAPEQIIGSDVDSRTDIYAFGLLLFFVLTGRTPFEVKRVQDTQEIARMQVQTSLTRPSTIRATLPAKVDDIFLKCVYKSPLSRYQSISELLADIRGLQATPLG